MIADCVRSHVAWIRLQAEVCGGATGRTGTIEWARVAHSGTTHLLFPEEPLPADVARITAAADDLDARAVALWSARDRSLPSLRDLGLRPGWQPWWMQIDPARLHGADPVHVGLADAVQPIDGALAPLVGRDDVLLAEARVDGRAVGRAWLHLDGEVAGLYDMAVAAPHRRRGLGRELLTLLAAEAVARGVRRVTLNATPEGAVLYAACGFRMLGAGRTWWRRSVR